MPCNIEKTKRISYYIDILFHIFASLHNIFYVLECMRLKKRRRVCYSAKKIEVFPWRNHSITPSQLKR